MNKKTPNGFSKKPKSSATITVSIETHLQLKQRANYGDSMDAVIRRLLRADKPQIKT